MQAKNKSLAEYQKSISYLRRREIIIIAKMSEKYKTNTGGMQFERYKYKIKIKKFIILTTIL